MIETKKTETFWKPSYQKIKQTVLRVKKLFKRKKKFSSGTIDNISSKKNIGNENKKWRKLKKKLPKFIYFARKILIFYLKKPFS